MLIRIKRVHEASGRSDSTRILVDRLWPRGLNREKADIHFWARDIAPTEELRKWYNHEPGKWQEFRDRYFPERNASSEAIPEFQRHLRGRVVTLLFSSRELNFNNAVALKEYIGKRLQHDDS